jgi:hypothetical protein
MKCIIYHSETIGLKIPALCTRCYTHRIDHKVNGILAMKKHVKQDHVVLLKRYVKEVHAHPQNLLN